MTIQIEVTTRCNFGCFYCVGRQMKQRDMDWRTFESVLDRLTEARGTVSLQGEGEPMLHPRFWDMVDAVIGRGFIPYTITNGSRIDAQRIAACFGKIGVSLDTIDPELADRIGRMNVPKVLANLERLLEALEDPRRLIVHSVDFGQDLTPLRAYIKEIGITRHYVQPLQIKDEYLGLYDASVTLEPGECSYRCRYVERPIMRYFDIEGTEMPCCFIKDARRFISTEHIASCLDDKTVPDCCAGCRELFPDTSLAVSEDDGLVAQSPTPALRA